MARKQSLAGSGDPVSETIAISLPGCEGVLFPAASVPRHLDPEGAAWTPTLEQIAEAERRLPAYLAAANPRLPASVRPGAAQRIAANLDRYARQYFGVSWSGRRLLYINCLPIDYRLDWRTQLVFVCDGGESFFYLLHDPESAEFTGLWVNGEA